MILIISWSGLVQMIVSVQIKHKYLERVSIQPSSVNVSDKPLCHFLRTFEIGFYHFSLLEKISVFLLILMQILLVCVNNEFALIKTKLLSQLRLLSFLKVNLQSKLFHSLFLSVSLCLASSIFHHFIFNTLCNNLFLYI